MVQEDHRTRTTIRTLEFRKEKLVWRTIFFVNFSGHGLLENLYTLDTKHPPTPKQIPIATNFNHANFENLFFSSAWQRYLLAGYGKEVRLQQQLC